MKVEVTVILTRKALKKHKTKMYDAAEWLTNDESSIDICGYPKKPQQLLAKFTVPDAQQIDVVDRIGKEFSYRLDDYSTSTIAFPRKKKRRIG